MMRQMFSKGEGTLLLWSHAVVIAAVSGFALLELGLGLPWNRCHLERSICWSKFFIYLIAFIVPSKTCKLPRVHICPLIPLEMLAFELSPSSLARRTRRPWFPKRMSNLDSSDHRTLLHVKKVKFFNEPWPTGHGDASGPCSPFCMIEL